MKDKTSIINAAQKFVAKGQIDKAIVEWEKLLNEKKDGNIHNTIGDLYLRKGAEKKAIESFAIAAEILKKDGFYHKAIALYKKILNIVPNNVDALISLAKLNAERGLIGNAVENFFKAAEIFNRDGATEKAVMAVEKILQLSPSDLNTRIKIAELYLRSGHRERAANEYSAIASTYSEKDENEKAREFYQKANELDPENIQVFIGLSRLEEKANNIDQSFGYLEKALSHHPDSKEILLSYSQLCIRTNKIDNAKNTLLKLIEKNPSDIQSKKLLGILYLREGHLEKTWEELLPSIDETFNAQNWSEALDLLNNFKDLYPIPVMQRLINIYKSQGDKESLSKELKNLANFYEEEGSLNEALQLYKEFLELNPDDGEIAGKIQKCEVSLGIAPPLQETTPEANNLMQPHEIVQEEITHQESEFQSPEEFAEKKAEADFFAHQGLKDEAINIYERLLLSSPDNEEIKKKIETLKTASTEAAEITVEKFPQEEPAAKAVDGSDLNKIFNEFGRSEEEDYESHYNAGIDYKEKGLFDEAIKEFQIVAKDPGKKQLSSRMLASCYMEKGAYPLAIREFNRVIEAMSPDDADYIDIKYELAGAYMNNKDYNKSLELYSEIQAQDSGFRDVSQKLDLLKTQMQKDKPKSKRDRVSYI